MIRQLPDRNVKYRTDSVGPDPSSDVWAEYQRLEALGHKWLLKESRDLNMVTHENTCGQKSTEQRIRPWAVVVASLRQDWKTIREGRGQCGKSGITNTEVSLKESGQQCQMTQWDQIRPGHKPPLSLTTWRQIMMSWRGVSGTRIRLPPKMNMWSGRKWAYRTLVVKHGFKGRKAGGGRKKEKKGIWMSRFV